jgi:hypothetical protein
VTDDPDIDLVSQEIRNGVNAKVSLPIYHLTLVVGSIELRTKHSKTSRNMLNVSSTKRLDSTTNLNIDCGIYPGHFHTPY